MDYLHQDFDLNAGDVVQVTLDGQANVMLLDQANYEAYASGRPYRYHGGHVTTSPVSLVAPHTGKWHVVVDLGGSAGSVRAGVSVLRGVEAAR
jgi:Domain of unknown function (DUF1883)